MTTEDKQLRQQLREAGHYALGWNRWLVRDGTGALLTGDETGGASLDEVERYLRGEGRPGPEKTGDTGENG
jgi:hypothetical protein